MANHKSGGKLAKGTVSVESFRDRLRLRLPRQLFDGKQKYLSLGLPDTELNRRAAKAKAKLIESDIALERFDHTLEKYGKQVPKLEVKAFAGAISDLSLMELWEQYFENKRSSIKPKTIEKYGHLATLFAKLGNMSLDNALAVKQKLESVTTIPRTRDALMYLSSACNWGLKHQLVTANPFVGMAQEMPQHRYITDPNPDSFTEAERDQVIVAFHTDKRKGMTYRPYAPFVEFMFCCCCRPSEAIGLRWKHVSEDCGTVSFEEALVQVGNRRVLSEQSKTNRTRTLSISPRVQQLLQAIRPEQADPEALIFPSPAGSSINYRNFSDRAWDAIVDPIKPDTTPYCCRDTFITLQLMKGVSSAVIAKWCDTSTHMIDKNYADKLKIRQIRPED